MSSWTRGVVVVALAVTASACAPGAVTIDPATPSAADVEACTRLVDALPETLDGRAAAPITPADAAGAAWGDPGDPTVLTCGPTKPDDGTPFAFCESVDGLDWYAPEEASSRQDVPVTLYLMGRSPSVRLVVPESARPPAEELTALAATLREHTEPAPTLCQE